MLLCDTMQERDMQNQLKKRKQEMDKHIENQWEDLDKQKMDEYDDKLRAKLMAEYDKKMTNSKVVKDQLHDFKMSYIRKIQEE